MLVTLYRSDDRITLHPRRGTVRVQAALADEVTLRSTLFHGLQVVRMGERRALKAAEQMGWIRLSLA